MRNWVQGKPPMGFQAERPPCPSVVLTPSAAREEPPDPSPQQQHRNVTLPALGGASGDQTLLLWALPKAWEAALVEGSSADPTT